MQIGDGHSPLTSGNNLDATLVVGTELVTAIGRDVGDNGTIDSSFINLFTDFQSRPSSGGVPIPNDHRADGALESTVTATINVDGITFAVIAENDGVNQWNYDPATGLMTASVDYNDVTSVNTGVFDGTLADYLVANPPQTGDNWTVTYNDSDGGNEQARFMRFEFVYDNPGDPSINVVGGIDAPNIIYGTSGMDSLTGGNVDDAIFGRENDDSLNGLGGNDILVGGAGDDILIGGGGNDFLAGGGSGDDLTGGVGADAFVIRSLGEGVDTIQDYHGSESDVIDISDILTGYDASIHQIENFVSMTSDGPDAIMAVDPAGTGAYTDIAILSNMPVGSTVTVIVDQDHTAAVLTIA
jgi:Ca2+-binding RTX toxin-like protein